MSELTATRAASNMTEQQQEDFRNNIGAGGGVLLETFTPSSVTLLNVTDLDVYGYPSYLLKFEELGCSSAGPLVAQVSTNNGVSVDSGATDYRYTTNGGGSSTNGAFVTVITSLLNAVDSRTSGFIEIRGLGSSSYTTLNTRANYLNSSGITVYESFGGRTTNQEDNAIRITMDGVKTFTGTFKLYGVK